MIKVALKHWIYEFCIDKIFDGIRENFQLYEGLHTLSLGDHLELKILIEDGEIVFKKCNVVYKKGTKHILVTHDLEVPVYLVIKDGTIYNITGEMKDKYEDYFISSKLDD
jgi:hypothetical protein